MRALKLNILLILITSVITLSQASAVENGKLQLHLPRTVSIKGELVTLGAVGVVGGPEAMVTIAKDVCVGKIIAAGKEITVERNTILSRLASSGITSSNVQITGAESVTIKRQGYTIRSARIIATAQTAINKLAIGNCQWKIAHEPRDITVDAEAKDVNVVAYLNDGRSPNHKQVHVSIMCRGKEIGFRDVAFGGVYSVKRIVSIAEIPAGTPFSPDNVRVENITANLPQDTFNEPYGFMAKRHIRASTVVTADMIESSKSAVLVNKSQGVVIQIKQPGLTITVLGEALQDGRAKELIKVRNIDSQKVLVAKVNEDGTVEPVF